MRVISHLDRILTNISSVNETRHQTPSVCSASLMTRLPPTTARKMNKDELAQVCEKSRHQYQRALLQNVARISKGDDPLGDVEMATDEQNAYFEEDVLHERRMGPQFQFSSYSARVVATSRKMLFHRLLQQ